MTCHDRCRFAQQCRLSLKANHREERCFEYMHWEDMALDAELSHGRSTDDYEEASSYAESEG